MTEKLVQALRADGSVDKKMDGGLGAEILKAIYRTMVTTRALGERAEVAQRTGKIGFYVPTLGQEASHVASAAAMEPGDWIFPSYRDVGIALWRNVPLKAIVDQLFGNSEDITKGRQMPVHYSFPKGLFVSVSSPIGTQIVQATGVAMAAKIRGDRVVASAYFGEGATSSNDFHTGLNFAGVYKAPVVFVCENNQWAISVPVRSQTGCETMAQKAQAYGFEGVRVDGNDALAVYAATKAAADKARSGGGPTLIETVTFRMGSHSTSDEWKRYRDAKEVEDWKKRDPIDALRRHLEKKKIWSAAEDEALWAKIREELNAAFKTAEKIAPPRLESLFDDVYADLPPHLKEQRDALLAEGHGHEKDEGAAFPL
jgi:pyruvate dehydrogenase E1 component subunit alpha